MKRLKIILFSSIFIASVAALNAEAETLDLGDVVSIVVENDTSIAVARESVTNAYHRYKLARSPGLPQLSLSLSPYGLSYRRDFDFSSFGDAFSDYNPLDDASEVTIPRATTLTHSWNAGIEYSQLLPTGGNAVVSVENSLNYSIPQDDDPDDGEDAAPDYISQAPEISIVLNQPFFVGDRFIDGQLLKASSRVAEIGWEQSRENERSIRNSVILGVVDLYLQLHSIERNLRFTEDSLRVALAQLRQARTDEEQGRASSNQVLGLQVAVNRQEEALLDLRYLKLQAERDLARMIGRKSLDNVELAESLESFSDIVDTLIESAEQQGPGDNPEIRNKRLGLEQAEWQARLNARESAPTVGLSFNLSPRYRDDREIAADDNLLAESFSDLSGDGSGFNINFGVVVNVPITDGGRRKASRNADLSSAELARLDLKKSVADLEDQMYLTGERDRILMQRYELVQVDAQYQKNRLDRITRLSEARSATQLEVDRVKLEYTASVNTLRETEKDLFLNRLRYLTLHGTELEKLFTAGN